MQFTSPKYTAVSGVVSPNIIIRAHNGQVDNSTVFVTNESIKDFIW